MKNIYGILQDLVFTRLMSGLETKTIIIDSKSYDDLCAILDITGRIDKINLIGKEIDIKTKVIFNDKTYIKLTD